jgi:Rieske Fe-S protein
MALGLQRHARANEFKDGRKYRRSHLVDVYNKPFHAGRLQRDETYLFHYPFLTTPCFLIDLGESIDAGEPLQTETGERYEWPGGVGPRRSIVAFSAICAHKMTHPARSVSFINYRPERITYENTREQPSTGRHLIYCCSERSVYDARHGARVLGGPAKQPLAAIGLDYDRETDALFATGTFGGEMFMKYFAEFTTRLQLEYEITDVSDEVGETTRVRHIDDFTKTRVLC